MDKPTALDREFLEMRSNLLKLAAALDRIERSPGSPAGDNRLDKIQRAVRLLGEARGNRAEQIQLLFSRDYHPDWQREFGLQTQRQ